MPPRKSTASTASAAIQSPNGVGDVSLLSTTTAMTSEPKSPSAHKSNRQSTGGDAEGEKSEKSKPKNDDIGIDDLLLPRTLTSRLSRGTLPPNTSIQRDALLALTKSATVFISYLGHTANSLTSRKTIQSQDILEALRETELWNVPIGGASGVGKGSGMTLGERVQAEVEKWEGEVRGKRKGYRERVKARESGGGGSTGAGAEEVEAGEAGDGEGESRGPIAKRARKNSDSNADITMDINENSPGHPASQGFTAKNERTIETDMESDGDAEEDADPEPDEEQDQVDDDEEDEEVEDEGDIEGEGESSRLDIDGEQEDENVDQDDDDDDAATRRRTRHALAPNGRVEVGSDEESD